MNAANSGVSVAEGAPENVTCSTSTSMSAPDLAACSPATFLMNPMTSSGSYLGRILQSMVNS